MHEEKFIGKTLREVAGSSGANSKGYVIFLLQDASDDTGKRVDKCIRVRHFLQNHPGMADCTVEIAYDYYGETILRVKEES